MTLFPGALQFLNPQLLIRDSSLALKMTGFGLLLDLGRYA
jgi:hypothetical protein